MFSGEQLRKKRMEAGYKQAELAQLLNISRASYFNWENNNTQPNQKNLEKLAQLLHVTPSYFQSEHEIVDLYLQLNESNQHNVLHYTRHTLDEQLREESIPAAPLFEYHVYEKLSAGTGYTALDDRNYDVVYFDEQIDYDIASWIFGDSMEPKYLNGSVALIKDGGFDYDGAIYAVVWDGQTYLKKVYREENGLRLVSLNKKYADKFAPYEEEPRVIGKIVGNFMPVER
ncbi:helix-turn-helix transcriptional regulator [Tuanshanicoccus lijuaniae]|uniref:LexA family transcriptional regulator n=1 Tax=Aerococcaceae bacterium zg-1292 TaxID=2774330 RepID=UPI00193603E3|nr:helix-turn-helix transcriptional regulator [Aerococcaceae bacterium zg-1292]MBF6625335.1 helix-turn-helix transcriptional regulator [Aerococcaceae bacterium zg-BR9]MBF6978463.1 helix-turn-helix transcriptional regulator [Aerococcaceae bacterium zg-BR22]MBS4456144.1 helix-turn-helix transcriptional regulator [Aerococcaceae bacterium zg-A91]MBS4457995.1 helix-turn-helix transcriptional regulator [Aerococcaceae bacterium zg-BR33]